MYINLANLTIARALASAKRLKGKISKLDTRLAGCSTWKGEKEPDFDFEAVLAERDEKVAELTSLRTAIARANADTIIVFRRKKLSLTEAIFRLDELKGRKTLFERLQLRRETEREHTGEYDENGRPAYEKVEWHSVWSEPERVEKLDSIQDEIDELHDEIEITNGKVLLIE